MEPSLNSKAMVLNDQIAFRLPVEDDFAHIDEDFLLGAIDEYYGFWKSAEAVLSR